MELAQQAGKGPQLKINQAFIHGRIDVVRSFDSLGKRVFEHRVVLPAQDQFSSPGAVLVQSSYKLGNDGEDVKLHVNVAGWRDSYKDRSGGQVQTARMVLRVVE